MRLGGEKNIYILGHTKNSRLIFEFTNNDVNLNLRSSLGLSAIRYISNLIYKVIMVKTKYMK